LRYNAYIADLSATTSQINQLNAQITQVQNNLQQQSNPALPGMVTFFSKLYQDAKADTIYTLYMANKAYNFWALNPDYDVFYATLGLDSPGAIDSAVIASAQISILNELETQIETNSKDAEVFGPQDSSSQTPGVNFTLTLEQNPLEIASLIANNELYFTIPPAFSNSLKQENPFAGYADVRLTLARPWITGAQTSDNILTVNLVHCGTEAFVPANSGPNGPAVWFSHDALNVLFVYDLTTNVISEDASIGVNDVNATYALAGPFTTWHLVINPNNNNNLDLSGVTAVTIEFAGTNYAFASHSAAAPAG
jgi:hypothetical protein